MLTPEYLADVPESMVQLYAQVEADILADMAQRLKAYDYWIPASEHQRRVLLEMGASEQEILKKLSAITGKSTAELKKLMLDAGQQALAADNAIYQEQGLQPPPLRASKPMQQVLNAGYARTAKLFRNLTRTTAHTASGQLEQVLDVAYMKVTSGAFDYNTAITHAIKSLAKQGLGAVRYPSGRVDTLETAVRRAVMTGVNQTALQLQMTLADELGSDLVEVTAHAGARPSHAVWQGQIYSRSGKSRSYPDFVQATGYGTGAGLGGWNCRHSFYPYFEGTSRTYSKELLDSYQAQNYTYNGRKMTEYEASQMQRGIERQIRRWKRENAAMQAAGLDSTESAVKLRTWQEKQKDFLRQTGLKRQTAREQVVQRKQIIQNKKAKKVEKPAQHDILKLNENEKATLQKYMSAESYQLNAKLRAGESLSEMEQHWVEQLDKALDKLPKYQGTVYRSMSSDMMPDAEAFLQQHEIGRRIRYKAYTSTSTEVYDSGMDIQLIIQSKTGCDMRDVNKMEQEVLFKRNKWFVVTKQEGDTIWLMEI